MEIDPFPASDFDHWAGSYEQDVSDESRFPFIGYRQALDTVVRLTSPHPEMRILDLGTGTGNLAAEFVRYGCEVWGTDFAPEMLARAHLKLPQVSFILADLRQGWHPDLVGVFDRIVSAYVFHHFELTAKVRLTSEYADHLTPQGKLVIADIAFLNRAALEKVKQAVGADWEEEHYWLADEMLAAYQQAGLQALFEPVSICAGVFEVYKK